MTGPLVLAALALAISGCADTKAASTKAETPPPRVVLSSSCPLNPQDLRLDSASFGGLPTSMTAGELLRACPFARLDTVGVGGTAPIALTFDVPGASLSAVQTGHEAYGDSLHYGERADLWIARGDSLRFSDGTLIPRTVGALRSLDSLAVIIVNHGDDGTGSSIVRCRFPRIRMIVDNVWPSFAPSGIVSFARASASDTTTIWRVEMNPKGSSGSFAAACRRARVT